MTETPAEPDSCRHCCGHARVSALWQELNEPLRAFIRSKVHNHDEADDLLQDVFIRIHNHIDAVKDQEKLRSWIYQIARNAIIDHYRTKHVADEYTDDLPEAEGDDAESPEMTVRLAASLHEMIGEIPEPYRRALILTELEGASQKTLAEKEGITLSGAKSRVQRGRRMLKDVLQDCCHFEFDRRGRLIDYYEHCCCCAEEK
jgi:RNA polymerase sigma-70 factor, ECF subfamily